MYSRLYASTIDIMSVQIHYDGLFIQGKRDGDGKTFFSLKVEELFLLF